MLSAVLVVVLFGVAALSVDLGNAFSRDRAAQTAADLAALAGSQGLPDPTCAWALAYDYLARNPVRTDAPGAPPLPATDVLADGDAANGEIEVRRTDGTAVAATPLTQPSEACEGSAAGAPVAGRSIRVVVPPRQVAFTVAAGVGAPGSTTVNAGATVVVRSPRDLHVTGLALPASCPETGQMALLVEAPGEGSRCETPTVDAFGYVDAWRADPSGGADARLVATLRGGVDHGLGVIPVQAGEPEVPVGSPACGADGDPVPTAPGHLYLRDGAETLDSEPNCLRTERGDRSAAVTSGFIGAGSDCDGRFTRLEEAQATVPVPNEDGTTCTLDATPFSAFGDPSRLDDPDARIDPAILRSPLFFVVPVLYAADRPGTVAGSGSGSGSGGRRYLRISGYRGAFVGCVAEPCNRYTVDTDGTLTALQIIVFDLAALGAHLPNTGVATSEFYAGAGPAVPVLVRDPLN